MSTIAQKVSTILEKPMTGTQVILTKNENVLEVMKGLSPFGLTYCTGGYVEVGGRVFWVKDISSPVFKIDYTLSAVFEGELTLEEKDNFKLWSKNAK